jgi:glutathione S-transferase
MKARLFGVPASHPSRAAELMLEHKGIPYRRFDLIPAAHKPILRAMRFPGVTVPALRLDGRRVQGTRQIALALDELKPDPPLVPEDPERRRAVEEAERWADEVLQPMPRRMSWWAIRRTDRATLESFTRGARIGLPVGLAVRTAGPFVLLSARLNRSTDENVFADLAALPGVIDRVEELIATGVVGGEQPNMADFQIATSIRLLLTFDDLRPALEERPAGKLALRLLPAYPGHVPPVFPKERLPDLSKSSTPSAPRTS